MVVFSKICRASLNLKLSERLRSKLHPSPLTDQVKPFDGTYDWMHCYYQNDSICMKIILKNSDGNPFSRNKIRIQPFKIQATKTW